MVLSKESQSAVASPFPWSNRTGSEWEANISQAEATRLFWVAGKQASPNLPDNYNSLITGWDLGTPFQVYWDNNNQRLHRDLADMDAKSRLIALPDELLAAFTATTSQIFQDNQSLLPFLLTARQVLRSRYERGNPDQGAIPTTFYEEIAFRTGWRSAAMHDLRTDYQRLVELFMPQAASFALKTSKNRGLPREDRIAEAHTQLATGVMHFYWETVVIDPRYTVRRFLSALHTAVGNVRMNQVFDTHYLEGPLTPEAIHYPNTPDAAQLALEAISEEEIVSFIRQHTGSKQDAYAFILSCFYNMTYREVAKAMGLSLSVTGERLQRAHRSVREALGNTNPLPIDLNGFRKQQTAPERFKSSWDAFLANPDLYAQLFQRAKKHDLLTNFQTQIMEAVLAEIPSIDKPDRNSLVRLVHQNHFPDLVPYTIRRHVLSTLKTLSNRPEENFARMAAKRTAKQADVVMMKLALGNPNFWSSLDEIDQRIAKLYVASDGRNLSLKEIGQEVGFSESFVSRRLEHIRIKIRKSSRK